MNLLKLLEIIFYVFMFFILLFLSYLTVIPFNIYDQISNTTSSNTITDTNEYLNNNINTTSLVLFENVYNIYSNVGNISYDVLTNSVIIKTLNNTYTYDIDTDIDKILLTLALNTN